MTVDVGGVVVGVVVAAPAVLVCVFPVVVVVSPVVVGGCSVVVVVAVVVHGSALSLRRDVCVLFVGVRRCFVLFARSFVFVVAVN